MVCVCVYLYVHVLLCVHVHMHVHVCAFRGQRSPFYGVPWDPPIWLFWQDMELANSAALCGQEVSSILHSVTLAPGS